MTDCILATLLGSTRNGRLEVTSFAVSTTFGTVGATGRDASCKIYELTAPGSIKTCPMCEGQRWIFNVPMILLWYTRAPGLVFDSREPAILELKVCRKLFFNLAQLGLDPSTARLTVHASSNCATLMLTVI